MVGISIIFYGSPFLSHSGAACHVAAHFLGRQQDLLLLRQLGIIDGKIGGFPWGKRFTIPIFLNGR